MSFLLMLWLSVVPKGVILVKGAAPAASDATTPLPEQGAVADGRFRNAYFGLSYPIPAGWKEQPAGPPPSEGGSYVLASFAVQRANVLLTAQDLFFGTPAAAGGTDMTIAGRTFHRVTRDAARSGLHWRILTTEARCHVLSFIFAGTDVEALDAGERAMSGMAIAPPGPACVAGYDKVVEKRDPNFANRFNTIPARIIVDADGRVAHVHLLSAFADQSEAILDALRAWRFEPYRVDGKAVPVETGMVFGTPRVAAKGTTMRSP